MLENSTSVDSDPRNLMMTVDRGFLDFFFFDFVVFKWILLGGLVHDSRSELCTS